MFTSVSSGNSRNSLSFLSLAGEEKRFPGSSVRDSDTPHADAWQLAGVSTFEFSKYPDPPLLVAKNYPEFFFQYLD